MNFESAAKEVFQVLRSYDYEVVIYDQEGMKTVEPEDGRRFFATKQNLLVAINDDGEDSEIRLIVSKDTEIGSVKGLATTLRLTATKFNMVFTFREQLGVISPKDFATKVSVTETRREMNLTEGMYGTSRSSYLRLENARMIVRHSAKIDEDRMGARGRNIDSIFVENNDGERHLFATTQLAPARAMTHHVSNGGSWSDEGGESITGLAHKFADLGTMSRHIYQNSNVLDESAKGVRTRVRECMRSMRKTFESICRKTRYEDVMSSIKKPLVEGEDLGSDVARLKSLTECDGKVVDERVLETVARALREAPEAVDRVSGSTTEVLGVMVDSAAWTAFKDDGTLDLTMVSPEQPPAEDGSTRNWYNLALVQVSDRCNDPSMGELLAKAAKKFTGSNPVGKPVQALASKVVDIVGWDAPGGLVETKSVKDFSQWIDGHSTENVTAEDCGHCPDDLFSKEQVDEDDVSMDVTGDTGEDLEESDEALQDISSIMLGGEDDDELTYDDILLPDNEGNSLAAEVDVATVEDPNTGEDVLPSDSYLQRLKTLSGTNNYNNLNW